MGPSNDEHNGHELTLTFGDSPGNVLSLPHAEGVLRLLWEHQRALLSAYIGEAFTGVKPQATRTRS